MRKSESVSVFQVPVQKAPPHRSFLPLPFDLPLPHLYCRYSGCRREGKPRPREKGTSAGRDKRSKAKGRQQVAGRSGQGSEKYESQEV